VLQRQTAHADAVTGLTLAGLRRTDGTSAVDSTADIFNSAQLPPFVRVTGNNGFLSTSLLTKHLHVQFVVVRQFSHW